MALKITIIALFLSAGAGLAAESGFAAELDDDGRHPPKVTVLVVPGDALPEDMSVIDGAAVGLMNPGLGDVSPEQTWLDVSQGARAFDSMYDTPLNDLSPTLPFVTGWEEAVKRAGSAGVDLRPGLLASVLRRKGLLPALAGSEAGIDSAALAAASLRGRLSRAPAGCPGPRCTASMTVSTVGLATAADLSGKRQRGELLIVVESPPADSGRQLAIAIAGPGFGGMLESTSTRTPGYVLSTDLAPTILAHLGLSVPSAMSGLAIESGGKVDYRALAELEGRYRQVGKSKGTAMLFPLLAWFLLAGLVLLATRGRLAGQVASTLCFSVILLPAVLLLTASLSPSAVLESAIAGVLPVGAAILILRRSPGWPGLAFASAVTVAAFSVDLVAGLALTPKAVIGPNPGLGARFYGIGNELESTLMVLTSVGCGAALQAWGGSLTPRGSASAFLLAGLAGTVVFASGSFGADVGAAIIFPVAAVVGAAVMLGRPRLVWLGAVAVAIALGLLALADTFTGSETHFVRSVFEGGPSDSALDVIAHRLDATADSFTSLSRLPVTLLAFALIFFAWIRRRRIELLFEGLVPVRAGLIAAAAASLVGALTNDSGALFVQVGVLYLGLVIAFTWAARPTETGS